MSLQASFSSRPGWTLRIVDFVNFFPELRANFAANHQASFLSRLGENMNDLPLVFFKTTPESTCENITGICLDNRFGIGPESNPKSGSNTCNFHNFRTNFLANICLAICLILSLRDKTVFFVVLIHVRNHRETNK